MKTFAQILQQPLRPTGILASTILALTFLATHAPMAQASSQAIRIGAEVSSAQRVTLPNSQRPLARAEFQTGRLAADTRLQGMSIHFSRSLTQEAELQSLLKAQQDPTSPLYHQWLTTAQYASRFGMADSDLAKVQSWLEQQGFQVDSISNGKDMIRFSGTAGQVEQAFVTEMHTYSIPRASGVEKHFAPSTALSIPSALSGVIESVGNLDDFRPHAQVVTARNRPIKPSFTSSLSGSVFFAPGDVATVYDVNKLYNSSITGNGQTIVIIGQSAIVNSDIEAFENAAGLTVKDPNSIIVPNSGTSTVYANDETESDLDIEWSGAIAKGAGITFVYTGSSSNFSAFDSLTYAIDNSLGTIISSSYGICEPELGSGSLETELSKAATKGITVISASGDSGSTDCFSGTVTAGGPTLAQQEVLAVDYPASSQYVTGAGGTEISQASSTYETAGDGYWLTASTSDVLTSAIQYIPEQVWNEDSSTCGQTDCLLSGGGGASALFTRPSWQTGVPGIPSANTRFVPDIALNASTSNPGYLFCTSDSSAFQTGQTASCTSGFRDGSTGDLTVAGGTSFAAPIFAGMVALINDDKGYTTGAGLINPTLYTLASNSTTYASAFHDITAGDNECRAGSSFCSGVIGFAAGTGYDEASGLGSIDLANLAAAWPSSTSTLIGTTTTVVASNTAPQTGATVTFTATVASSTGSTVPTGTLTITVDSGTPITGNALTSQGTFAYMTSFATAGTHTLIFAYSGDATHASSTGSASVNVSATSSGKGTFTVSATNVTVTQGNVGTGSITVTPAGGYTGTVTFTASTTNSTLQSTVCPVFTNALVSGTTPVNVNFTIDTNAANCQLTGQVRKNGQKTIRLQGMGNPTSGPLGAAAVIAGLLMAGLLGRRSRKLRMILGVVLLAVAGFAFSGCGGGGGSTSVPNAPKGTYTISLSAQDSTTTTITASTTFTLTIQ